MGMNSENNESKVRSVHMYTRSIPHLLIEESYRVEKLDPTIKRAFEKVIEEGKNGNVSWTKSLCDSNRYLGCATVEDTAGGMVEISVLFVHKPQDNPQNSMGYLYLGNNEMGPLLNIHNKGVRDLAKVCFSIEYVW